MLALFRRLGPFLRQALSIIRANIPDAYMDMALMWVRVAAEKELDNTQRREFVVQMLMKRGIPESLARLATELAVQVLKREQHG